MTKNGMRPIHSGEVLREDFLAPIGMSVNALAQHLHVPTSRMNDIVRERRRVTPDTAMRLARLFGGGPESWLNLQQAYDLKIAAAEAASRIEREVRPLDTRAGHNSLQETLHLLGTPANANRLRRSIAGLRAGKTFAKELLPDDPEEGGKQSSR